MELSKKHQLNQGDADFYGHASRQWATEIVSIAL